MCGMTASESAGGPAGHSCTINRFACPAPLWIPVPDLPHVINTSSLPESGFGQGM